VLVLSRAEVERALDIDALIDALGAAFIEVSEGRASVPPRIAAHTPMGFTAAMEASVGGILAAKLVSVFPRNHERGLPSHQAIVTLFDEETGTPLSVMDGTYLTAMRTAAASALATRALARADARVLAVLGAGVQARSHLQVVTRVRDFQEIRVANRSLEAARLLADEVGGRSTASFEEAARDADVICACTDSDEPVLRGEWLAPGSHVTSVGYSAHGGELDQAAVLAGLLVVESRVALQPPPAGAAELQGLEPGQVVELGEVLSGRHPGRTSAEEITVYKSMGHAVEDAVAARLTYDAARAAGAGISVEL
jgi:ornithine cyclodeaminase/alanine dehydrogenase-like protein (mu-crystallin family)